LHRPDRTFGWIHIWGPPEHDEATRSWYVRLCVPGGGSVRSGRYSGCRRSPAWLGVPRPGRAGSIPRPSSLITLDLVARTPDAT
jgi:hypothetical protein